MKGKLRTFGQCTKQYKHEHHGVQGMVTHGVTRAQDLIEIITTHDAAKNDHPAQEREPACTRYCERHARSSLRVRAMMPVANQKEGCDTCEFPKDDQLQEVA